jgi:hypothetical protein
MLWYQPCAEEGLLIADINNSRDGPAGITLQTSLVREFSRAENRQTPNNAVKERLRSGNMHVLRSAGRKGKTDWFRNALANPEVTCPLANPNSKQSPAGQAQAS